MQKKDKTKALTSFILGIFFWVPLFNVIFAIIGLIVGFSALKEIKTNPNEYEGKGLAIAGIVMCCIPIIGGIFLLLRIVIGI